MARTLAEIRSSFYAAKASRTELDNLQSTPDGTATWELWSEVVIFSIWLLEKIFDTHKSDIEDYINNSYPNTIPWIHSKCLSFQYGDNLEYINNRYVYAVIDETKMIIKRVAVVEYGKYVYCKIATENAGVPAPLSTVQLNAFKNGYITRIKAPGQQIIVINENADLINIVADVYYNPLLLLSDGSLIADPNVKPVEEGIVNYLKNIKFGGELNINNVLDSITGSEGVTDGVVTLMKAKADSAPAYNAVTHLYTALSGYYKINSLTLNYIPSVSA